MRRLSILLVALAALFWGLSGGIGGLLIADGYDPFLVSWYRGAMGLLFVLGWLAITPNNHGFANRRLWFWSIIAGLGVAGNFSFYFISIEAGSVAVASTLMYCAPVFVYLISFMLNIESSSPLKWAGIALALIGIVLLTQVYHLGPEDMTLPGVGAGLLAGLCYTLFIFGFRYASHYGSPPAILSIAFAVLALLLIGPSESGQISAVWSSPALPLFALLGVLGAGISFIIYIVGLKETPPAVASTVAMIEPVTAALFGVLALGESLNLLQITGMILIVITVTGLSVGSERSSSRRQQS